MIFTHVIFYNTEIEVVDILENNYISFYYIEDNEKIIRKMKHSKFIKLFNKKAPTN